MNYNIQALDETENLAPVCSTSFQNNTGIIVLAIILAVAATAVFIWSIIDDFISHEIYLWKLSIPIIFLAATAAITSSSTYVLVAIIIGIILIVLNDIFNTETFIGRADSMYLVFFIALYGGLTLDVMQDAGEFGVLSAISLIFTGLSLLLAGLVVNAIIAIVTFAINKTKEKKSNKNSSSVISSEIGIAGGMNCGNGGNENGNENEDKTNESENKNDNDNLNLDEEGSESEEVREDETTEKVSLRHTKIPALVTFLPLLIGTFYYLIETFINVSC